MRVSRVQVKAIPPMQKRPALRDRGHGFPSPGWIILQVGGGGSRGFNDHIEKTVTVVTADTHWSFTHPQVLSLPPTQVLFEHRAQGSEPTGQEPSRPIRAHLPPRWRPA